MAIPPDKFRERVANAKQRADIKAVIDSTGAILAHENAKTGEYMYHAPYRDDSKPSLKINVPKQVFIDFGQSEAEGDVIALTRLILGRGDANATPFFDAVRWLERFSGGTVAPRAIQPSQRPAQARTATPHEGERFVFASAKPVTAKTHPSNLDYITQTRKISLAVASRFLQVIGYKDRAAAFDDPMRGMRYGIGGANDAGGYEVRAASLNSNFKTSLGPKDITSFNGHPSSTTGDIFEGRFDFLTMLEMSKMTAPVNPVVILNTGRFAARAAEVIKNRPEWQHVRHWRIWQHNDDEGDRTTQALIEGLGEGYTVGTLNSHYEGYNDLNQFWTDAPDQQRSALTATMSGNTPIVQKSYDTSASTEARRTLDTRLKSKSPKLL